MGEKIVKGGPVCYNGQEKPDDLPTWAIKLGRRVAGLAGEGRYQIVVTLGERPDWTVTYLGRVERPSEGD